MSKKMLLCIGVGVVSACSVAVGLHFLVKKQKETRMINEMCALGVDINDPCLFETM